MNKYLGTKEVLAKPMTRIEYNQYRGWQLPENENGSDEGFLIEYVDGGQSNDSRHAGYISWSPADVFAQAYASYDTWLDRVKLEQAKLQTDLDGLNKALDVERKPDFISDEQWIYMTRQQFHMRQYNQILLDRIANASPKSNEQLNNAVAGSEATI